MRATAPKSFALLFIAAALGCTQILGLDGPYKEGPASPSGGGGGGGGGGAAGPCSDGATMKCYNGLATTENVGICKAGVATCAGGEWGACDGEILPAAEVCDGDDDDCDGTLDNDCPCGANECNGALTWAKSFGSAADERLYSIATDSQNNVVAIGSTGGTPDFGGGPLFNAGNIDVWIATFDPAGNPLWSKSFGSANIDSGRAIAIDASDNIYIAGIYQGPISFGGPGLTGGSSSLFVVKLNSKGQHVWSRGFTGPTNLSFIDLATDAAGNVLLTAIMQGSADFGGGVVSAAAEVILAVKLDAGGTHVWSKGFAIGNCCGSGRTSIAVDASGNIALAGGFRGQLTFGGATFVAKAVDIFVAKLSPAGDHIWSVQGEGNNDDQAAGVDFDAAGDVIINGTFASDDVNLAGAPLTRVAASDVFIAKLTAAGAPVWAKGLGLGGKQENASDVKVDALGNVVITGNEDGEGLDLGGGPLGVQGPFLAKYDAAGNHLWSKAFSAVCCNFPTPSLTIDRDGYPSIAALYATNVDFGAGVFTVANGDTNVFIAKFAP